MKSELAWHFLAEKNGRPVYRDGKPAHAGDVLTHADSLVLCKSGLHYSTKPIDAVKYAPGPWICRVRVGDERKYEGDKGVCRRREILWMADAMPLLQALARSWAASVLHLWPAPEIVVRYLATGDESIRAAAWAAAWAAAGDAARAAAGDAARAAAGAAAGDAARAAAWAAAWAAAGAAARDAARDAQNAEFEAALATVEREIAAKGGEK